MSQMMPPQGGGPDIHAILAQLGGGHPDQQPHSAGNWLVEAINAVHAGMVEEHDPQIVSMLGAILNNLTTVQAKVAGPQQPGQASSG